MNDMEYILEVNNLTKTYPAFELKPISFHIKAETVQAKQQHLNLFSISYIPMRAVFAFLE